VRGRDHPRGALLPLGVATDIWDLSASELAERYRSPELSPREVVDSVAERIERLNPVLGAFTTLCLDRAREEADQATAAFARGDEAGPLAGVPFAAKDLFDSAGVRTTYGSRMFASNVPERDAAAVAALRRAGAILVGKTQTHEFAWGITSINEAIGSSRNPWDTARVPGGSSGGSAVALAAGLVPLALGSDTGGSIRIPAAFCGVTALKPTYGRVPTAGLWPLAPSLDHAGPMARTPDDLAFALGIEAGGSVHGITVVTCPDLHLAPLAPDVERAYRDALATLEGLGARVDERPLAVAARVDATFRALQAGEALRVHREAGLYPARADEYGGDVRRRLDAAAALDPGAYVAAVADREAIRAGLGALVADGALLVTPVAAVTAAPADDVGTLRAAVLPYTTPQNLAGLPACAVRAGFDSQGLPIGIQFTAAPWREADALRAARAFHEATGDLQARRPLV
jgi:aspartyl-tRNA(Asn)/glutamyl-tRNA(Gln) amidotransferase subunit A